jgi:type I restriction enzyme, S subunit
MSKVLKDAVKYSGDRISLEYVSLENYVTTDNLLQNKQGKVSVESLPPNSVNVTKYEKGDILISNIRPYLKKIWYANHSGGSSADVLTLKVNNNFDSNFIYYTLFQDVFFEHMMNGSKGTKMPRGDKNQILDFPIPNFPIPSQKSISKVLSDIDAKIELNNRINRELETMAKTLYDYWFVQFDFPNEQGKPYKSSGGKMVYNAELKRDIPEGWEVNELRSYLTSNRGVSYNGNDIVGNGIPMINLNSFNINSTYKHKGIKSYSGTYSSFKVLKPFDLVMCNTQQTALDTQKDIIGKSFLIPDIFETDVVSSHHVTTISVIKDSLKFYLNSLFNTVYFHRYISGYATGTNILGLNFEGVLSYLTAIPNDELLSRYKAIILPIEKQKSRIIKENQKLSELRDWLLPMLMNGQVTVR